MKTRAIRNCNPLNIRFNPNNAWKGRTLFKHDTQFEEFIGMDFGFRAAVLLLRNYITRGYNTIEKIITRWAPPADRNNTQHYIQTVCHITSVGGREPLSVQDTRIKEIVWAMAQVEAGKEILNFRPDLDKAFDNSKL